MENFFIKPYQYWAFAGFIFLFIEIFYPKTFSLLFAGGALFAAVIAFKFPDEYIAQFLTFIILIPLIFFTIKPYVAKKDKKNEQ